MTLALINGGMWNCVSDQLLYEVLESRSRYSKQRRSTFCYHCFQVIGLINVGLINPISIRPTNDN
jgi:hypothetical protein